MSALRALQGLVGGLNSGLGNYTELQEQQAQMANRDKLTALQAEAERRAAQAQEFEELKAKYLALNPEQDLDVQTAQPFISKGFSMVKGPTGFLRRPGSVQEQKGLNEMNPEFVQKIASAQHAPIAAEGELNRKSRFEELQAQLANAANIASGNNATSVQVAGMNNDARVLSAEAQAAAMRDRAMLGMEGKAINEPEYIVWKNNYMRDPVNAAHYNEALKAGKSASELDLIMRSKIYPKYRNAGLY